MDASIIILCIIALAALGFVLGRRQAILVSASSGRKLHSLPGYYGQIIALSTAVPALILLGLWLLIQPPIIESRVSGMIPESSIAEGSARSLVMADVRRIADGLQVVEAHIAATGTDLNLEALDADNIRARLAEVGIALGAEVPAAVFEAAKAYREQSDFGHLLMTIAVLALSLAALPFAYVRINPELRARNMSESFVKTMLLIASLVAILTTVGIVLSGSGSDEADDLCRPCLGGGARAGAGFVCPPGGAHVDCTCCGTLMPERRGDAAARVLH
ncbi:MAG: phosphate ABC transporter permease family protein, partial [Allorhizobium sp.]